MTTDEEYLIQRARQKGEPEDQAKDANAQAWLVTSKIIFPHVFDVQYEFYDKEKDRNNEIEAAKSFTKLFRDFGAKKTPENVKLWSEIDQIVAILASESREESFMKKLFYALEPQVQRELLLNSAFQRKVD